VLRRRHLAIPAALAVLAAAAGCGRSGPGLAAAGSTGPRFTVVAAENFWGSIAAQLAGNRASVASIIVNPATDPHSYQPTAADARAIAGAGMVIFNGAGYDNWAPQLLEASPSESRAVLDIGRSLGLGEGANPHRWYYPADVHAVIARILAGYDRLDPADAAYFATRARYLQEVAFARYDSLRAEIRARYAGVAVGYSESIFQGLGGDLHLRLLTPPGFVRAIADGTDVTAQEKETVDRQALTHQIRVWVFNSQNVTPDVQRVNQLVAAQHIPIATVTETLSPASATFEQWQANQLEGLLLALRRATGR
jgi:zinc/manganese transport system substrate-binding protein